MTKREQMALQCAREFQGYKGTWADMDEAMKVKYLKTADDIYASADALAEYKEKMVWQQIIAGGGAKAPVREIDQEHWT